MIFDRYWGFFPKNTGRYNKAETLLKVVTGVKQHYPNLQVGDYVRTKNFKTLQHPLTRVSGPLITAV